jgi:hypothetical protein
MPLTARMRRELDRMEAANQRQLFMNGSESHGNFRGLTNEEFEDVQTHPFWAEIREFHLSDAPRVTQLPLMPRQLQLLALRKTGVLEFPDLPPTLTELQLERNTHLKIPNEISRRITHIVLKHNGIKEIPYLHHTTKFLIREPDLVEPFRTILEEYTKRKGAAAQMRPQTAESRQEVVDAQRDFYTNLQRAWLTKKANVRRRGRNVATLRRLEKASLSALRAGIPEEVASFLSAKAAHNPLEEQLISLREEHESLPRSARGGTRLRLTRKRR